ncbi:MAG: arginine--tRNA ligase [Candidatus Marinimicrobia bacterium]|nr:arginine--tRNA ligase [Candidatus Neomarinimicrobiota bacterium]
MKNLKINLIDNISLAIKSLSFPQIDYNLTQPKNPQFGDLSTNAPLLIASQLKQNPIEIGELIVKKLQDRGIDNISNINITAPGFINFKISDTFFQKQIKIIIESSHSFGKGSLGIGKTANVEFVSANPTGPLTVGHGRNAVIGDVISKILAWQGFKVTKEYYFNDAGRQMRILKESVKARYYELIKKNYDFPKDGYQGDYIYDIAKNILQLKGDKLNPENKFFKKYAEDTIFKNIKESLMNLGIQFDQFTNEKTFYENGDIDNLLKKLSNKNLIYKKDNATWFKSSALGKEHDKVYIKSSGEPTYRVPDTAYHINKIKRKYDLIIDIFGSDHADAYPDVLIALEALDLKTDHIKILLYQFVTLIRNGKKVKMSTRQANFITLDELIEELGPDVVRYFFIMRSINSHLDFDIDIAADQSDKNPVFYLQYAYARICNIIKRADELRLINNNTFNYKIISHQEEIQMLKHMVRFPEFIEISYKNLEPQYITIYLQQLASFFHKFYSKCKVITDNKELTTSRINLIKSVKIILQNGFNILGIKAPEKM